MLSKPKLKLISNLHPIQENKSMLFSTNNTWYNNPTSEISCINPLDFKPIVCNWFENEIDSIDSLDSNLEDDRCHCDIYNSYHDNEYHHEQNTSCFPNPLGETVYFDQDDIYEELDIQICSLCDSIQDDNILFICCRNKHYLCSECFYNEKNKAQRQNIEFELYQRNGIQKNETFSKYEFICSSCNTIEKLNFNIIFDEFYNDLEIIQIYK